ncbi:MAG TPA: hypothetical protein VKU39_16165 [Streptosporangiaceae bacterium]|nr:hypothetical protein [Streptosporangiaceae bacterium]
MLIALAAAPPPVSQCQTLPSPTPSASASASPSSSDSASPSSSAAPSSSGASTPASTPASAVQLCVSVQAEQGSYQTGQAALYIVQVWVQGGSAAGVIVSVASDPAGAYFTQFCPGGNGSASCAVGTMGTDTDPSDFRLEAATNVLGKGVGQAKLSVTAVADTSPAMTVTPYVSQSVPIVAPPGKPSPKPSGKPTPARTPGHPASTPVSVPPAVAPLPGVGTLPSLVPVPVPGGSGAGSASQQSLASALPVVTAAPPASPQLALPPASEGLSPAAALSTEALSSAAGSAAGGRHVSALEQTLAWVLVLFGLALVLFLGSTRFLSRRKGKRARPRRPAAPVKAAEKPEELPAPALAAASTPASAGAPVQEDAADATATSPMTKVGLKVSAPDVEPVEDRWHSLPGEYLG